jgi:hypothetical protein
MKSVAVFAGIATILAVSGVHAQQSVQKWGAHIDFEAKPGSKRNIGEADFFLPLMQDSNSLFFGNARLRLADHDNHEGNIGLGYRKMLEGGWNLGGYGYFDRRKTSTGNKFNQATFGAEALGRDFDFRGNVYLPQGDRVRELGTTTIGGTPTAALVGTTVQVTTPGTTTFTAEERALKGYDVEAGWRAPVWAAEADKQLRFYAGGYHFSDGGVRVSGPRVRAELAMTDLPALWKGAQLLLGAEYQDDNARGGQGFVSVRLRIPLGGEKDSGGKLNFQERRMTAPVVRDVDVVTQARSVVTATTPAVVETATQTPDGQPITVLSSGSADGAAFQTALATAGPNSTVVLSGNFNTTTQTTLQPGQTVAGGGVQVLTPSGRTATLPSTGATWTGTNIPAATYTVAMANNSTLQGLTISDTESVGGTNSLAVRVSGVSGARVINNVINATSTAGSTAHGVDVVSGSTNVTISGNRITTSSVGANGIGIQMNGAGTTGTVSNNTVMVSGASNLSGIVITSNATSAVTGNRVTVNGGSGGAVHGIEVDAGGTGTLSSNTVTVTGSGGGGANGITVNGSTGVIIANSTITVGNLAANSSNGIVVTGVGSATITGNSISAVSNNNTGVATAINMFSATSTATIANNTLSGSGSSTPGFNRFLSFGAGATANAGSTGNTATAGNCNNLGAVGSVSFTNGTTCP